GHLGIEALRGGVEAVLGELVDEGPGTGLRKLGDGFGSRRRCGRGSGYGRRERGGGRGRGGGGGGRGEGGGGAEGDDGPRVATRGLPCPFAPRSACSVLVEPERGRLPAVLVGEAVLPGEIADVEHLARPPHDVRIGSQRRHRAPQVLRRLRGPEIEGLLR